MKSKDEIEALRKKIIEYGRRKNLRYPGSRLVLAQFGMVLDWVLELDGYQEEPFTKMVDDLGETKDA
jgi:hypothetical protein